MVSQLEYRRTIAFGVSAGGLAAICAGNMNRWDSVVAVGCEYPKLVKHLLPLMPPHPDDEAKKQRIRIYYSELHPFDPLKALSAARITKGQSKPMAGCKNHVGLWEIYQRGELQQVFAEFFGQAVLETR